MGTFTTLLALCDGTLRVEIHDDVIKQKHLPCYWPFVMGHYALHFRQKITVDLIVPKAVHSRGPHGSGQVDSPHKGQWCGALMFSLICTCTNDWANSRDTGDLRCHGTHCDTIVMSLTNHLIHDQTIIIHTSHTLFYCQISNISGTKPRNSNVSGLVLHLSLCNLLKPGVDSRMKM